MYKQEDIVKLFKFIVPKALTKSPNLIVSKVVNTKQKQESLDNYVYQKMMSYKSITSSLKYNNKLYFPHKNLV